LDAEVLGLALVRVADRALAGLDGLNHPGRLGSGLAALQRPAAVGLIGPDVPGGLMEIVREVRRGPGLIRAVDRRDVGIRQIRVGVVRRDRRVVPLGDLTSEDLRRRLWRQLEILDVGQVVDDRDRREVVRQLDQLATLARAPCLGLGELLLVERRVAAAEGGLAAGDELIATTAGPDRVIGDRRARVVVLELGDPRLLGGLLRA